MGSSCVTAKTSTGRKLQSVSTVKYADKQTLSNSIVLSKAYSFEQNMSSNSTQYPDFQQTNSEEKTDFATPTTRSETSKSETVSVNVTLDIVPSATSTGTRRVISNLEIFILERKRFMKNQGIIKYTSNIILPSPKL